MKGLFIPGITAKMFKDASLESVAELMTEGEIYDIDYQEPCDEFCEMKKDECIFYVYKNEKNKKREEIIKMLMMLKKQARYNDTNTLIEDVRLSSFNFVIDKVIKSLETESEGKNDR